MKKILLILFLCPSIMFGQALHDLPDVSTPTLSDMMTGRDVSETGFNAAGSGSEFTMQGLIDLFGLNFDALMIGGNSLHVFDGSDWIAIEHEADTGNLYIRAFESGDTSGDVIIQDVGGNVGIGAVTPTEKLHVVGTVKATAFEGDGSALTGLSSGASTGSANTWTARQTFQQTSGIVHAHGSQGAFSIDVSTNQHSVTATSSATVTISGTAPPGTSLVLTYIQDGTGGRTPTISPVPSNGQPTVNETASAITTLQFYTHNGSSWLASSSYGAPAVASLEGVRSEMIPVGWMLDDLGNNPAAEMSYNTAGTSAARIRVFEDGVATDHLDFQWQKPADAIDGNTGTANFQIKWRVAGIATVAGDNDFDFLLAGVGRSDTDDIDGTLGTSSTSASTGGSVALDEVVFTEWSEITIVESGTDGWFNFEISRDGVSDTGGDIGLAWIEFLFKADPSTVSYASP